MMEQTMTKPVFQSVSQALHVSFMIMSVEARQDSPMRNVLIRMMSEADNLSRRQRDWLDQLIGEKSGSIDFSGLTGTEIRAQCAMVTQIVRDHLPAPEKHVIQARYIPAAEEEVGRDQNNRPLKRFYYSQERVNAVKGLSDYWRESKHFSQITGFALDMMVARAFVNHAKIQISYRELAQNFGGNHMTYARAYKLLKSKLNEIEEMAVRRLTHIFEESSLVE